MGKVLCFNGGRYAEVIKIYRRTDLCMKPQRNKETSAVFCHAQTVEVTGTVCSRCLVHIGGMFLPKDSGCFC